MAAHGTRLALAHADLGLALTLDPQGGFEPDAPLEPGATYALPFGERWCDLSGNALVPQDLVFTVELP